jgi:Tfp pilus assembly protein FimT
MEPLVVIAVIAILAALRLPDDHLVKVAVM